jgi:PAS domain S-box-containing protein
VGTATDVDESRRREAELRGATAELGVTLTLLEELQSKAPIGLGFVDRDFRVVRVNEVLAALVGATADALIGETVERAFPDVWRRTESFYRAVLDTGEAVVDIEVDRPAVSVGGASEQRWLTSYYPLVLDGGVAGVGVVVVDVTDRVEGEATRRLLAAIVESSADAIIGVTVEGVVTSWNGAAERLFGYTAAEIIGVPISVLAPSGRRSEQAALRSLLLAGASFERVETIRRRKDGTMVEVLVTASTVTDADGSIVGLSVIAHDITRRRTEQRALEAGERRLAEAQRVAKLGSFEYDVGADELRWSAECARILGVDPAVTPTVALFTSLVDRADARVVSRLWRDAAGRGRPFDDELRVTGAPARPGSSGYAPYRSWPTTAPCSRWRAPSPTRPIGPPPNGSARRPRRASRSGSSRRASGRASSISTASRPGSTPRCAASSVGPSASWSACGGPSTATRRASRSRTRSWRAWPPDTTPTPTIGGSAGPTARSSGRR